MLLIILVSLAVPPTVENAEVSVAVSADSRRAIATYSTGGIYSILENSTLVFDCNSGWTPALPQVTGIKCMNTTLQCLSGWPLVYLYNIMLAPETNILSLHSSYSFWLVHSKFGDPHCSSDTDTSCCDTHHHEKNIRYDL